jgi:TRAP-type C4-dicarboxylate transport system permease small subunit
MNYFKAKGANRPAIVLAVVILAVAVLIAWFGYDTGSRSGYWIAGSLAVLAFLVLKASWSQINGNVLSCFDLADSRQFAARDCS